MFELFNHKRFNLLSGDITVRNSLVTFDGRMITDFIPRANILDIRIGAPGIETTAVVRGYSAGSDFVHRRHTTRIIEIEVELPLDRDTYPENVQLLRAWADTDEPAEMILSAYRDRKINVTCTNTNSFSQKEWWMPVILTFEAWDPYFISRAVRSADVGSTFTINGDAPPLMTISHNLGTASKLTAPKWTLDGAKYIALAGTYTAGEVKVDCTNGTFTHNSNNIASDLTLSSRLMPFAEIKPGEHTISGPSGGTVTWYERWL